MFALTWYSIILISIPQTILVVKLGFELFHLQVDLRKCLLVALIVGFITYFLRRSSIIPGIHTVILIIIITIFVTVINKGNILHNLASVLLGSMIMGVIEGVWCPLFLSMTSHSFGDLGLYPLLNIAGFTPILLITFIIYVLTRKYHFVIYNLGNKGM